MYLFLFSIVAETSTGCLLAGSSLGKRGKSGIKFLTFPGVTLSTSCICELVNLLSGPPMLSALTFQATSQYVSSTLVHIM